MMDNMNCERGESPTRGVETVEINKIIIDPHNCSREEYQGLKDYLTKQCWDWQEVSRGLR